MPVPPLTCDELVATLQRTKAPTLLVEGTDDADVYRLVERRLGLTPGTVLCCGGRDTLLRVFLRRSEFADSRCAFLADRDLWLFSSIPPAYEGVIFTRGYSIENDVLNTPGVELLLEPTERSAFMTVLDLLSSWFAFEVDQAQRGAVPLLAVHIQQVLDLNAMTLSATWVSSRPFVSPDAALTADIRTNYRLKLRGKQLLQALVLFLSASGRRSKYSRMNLLEIASTNSDHESLQILGIAIRDGLGIPAIAT